MIGGKISATPAASEQHGWFARASGALRTRLFSISTDETRVERRGFTVKDPAVAVRLETIGMSFVNAYNAAVATTGLPPLMAHLEAVPAEYRGFAYEGAGMGLTVRDAVTPGPSLWRAYVAGPALSQHYISFVGRGWAFARLPGPAIWHARSLKGPLRWLAFDGYGFHQGFFDWQRSIDACMPDRGMRGYALRAFDQGLGRSLWFVRGADVSAIASAIGRFDAQRRTDLWAGVGLAATYAGGLGVDGLEHLLQLSAIHRPSLAQGAVFAAEARHRAGIVTAHCETATSALCAMTVADASQLAVSTKPDESLPDPDGMHYEAWRRNIRLRFA